MNTQEKIEKLSALKEAYEATQARLLRARQLEEQASSTNLATLLESELERAELILAAKDLNDKLQKMAEDLAKMQADAMPLSDNMKASFGPEHASDFESSVTQAIQNSLQAIRVAKDEVNTAILRVEGKISDEDQAPANDMNMGDPAGADPMAGADTMDAGSEDPFASAGADTGSEDPFAGAAAASGPADEPLGRAKRESAVNRKPSLKESGEIILATESLESLIDWVLTEASAQMQTPQFRDFAKNVAAKAAKDPARLAGWIGQRKYGASLAAQLSHPIEATTSSEAVNPAEEAARGIAEQIDANIAENGRGRAAEVVEAFNANGLNEAEAADVLAVFEQMFGTSPAHYSMKRMREAAPVNPVQQKKQQAALGKMAGAMATDKNMGNKPISSAMSGMDAQDRSTVQGVVSQMKKDGKNPQKVSDVVGAMAGDEDDKPGVNEASATAPNTMNKGTPMSTDAGKHKANTNRPKQTSNQSTKPLKPTAKASGVLKKGTVSEAEQVDENINEPHWPTNTAGQYKGEPFSTDYGKLKAGRSTYANSGEETKTDGGPLKPTSKGEDVVNQGKGPDSSAGVKEPKMASKAPAAKKETPAEPKKDEAE